LQIYFAVLAAVDERDAMVAGPFVAGPYATAAVCTLSISVKEYADAHPTRNGFIVILADPFYD
jgi:hypothetical protein